MMNGNNREDFSKWLSTTELEDTTCKSYLRDLDNLSTHLGRDIDVYSKSIGELNNLDVELTECMSASTDDQQEKQWSNRRSSVRKYKEFISNYSQGISTKTKGDSMENATKEYKDLARNKIYFGAPGVGKSYNMNRLAGEYFEGRYDRVTFYSDYSYAQFVGCYKPTADEKDGGFQNLLPLPAYEYLSNLNIDNIDENFVDIMKEKTGENTSRTQLFFLGWCFPNVKVAKIIPKLKNPDDNYNYYPGTSNIDYNLGRRLGKMQPLLQIGSKSSPDLTYRFVPGPFIRTLVNALNNPDKGHLLIIEEINRADAAGVFGDAFQLLDRQHNGESEYAITPSKDLAEYLDGKVPEWRDEWSGKLKIPSNMFIWATMNSADQGVFPLDTAFKRRWSFEYIPIDNAEDEVNKTWNNWRKDINKKLQELEIEEDKFLGAHFISRNIVGNCDRDITQDDAFKREFKNKVLMYLFEDAGKYHREDIFGDSKITLSEVFERFESGAKEIQEFIDDGSNNKIEEYDILKLLQDGTVTKVEQ